MHVFLGEFPYEILAKQGMQLFQLQGEGAFLWTSKKTPLIAHENNLFTKLQISRMTVKLNLEYGH